jgi:hypothetical protein
LSTLERADRIVVFSHGKIVEIGKPKELLAQGGAFAELVRAQQQPGTESVDVLTNEDATEVPSRFVPLTQLYLRYVTNEGLFAEHRDSGERTRVSPVRAFPLTAPQRAVCLVDGKGREISMIDELDALDSLARAAVLTELGLREFRPVLECIDSVDVKTTHSEWHVRTDRGNRVFRLEDEDQIRMLGAHRAVIVDHGGTRYLLTDLRQLDEKSRRILHRFT